jgi:hypothetical protein
MTTLTQVAPHPTTRARYKARKRRSFDGLLASYIRELAQSSGGPSPVGVGEGLDPNDSPRAHSQER